ncbi:MAG: hypothetical protein H6Q71_1724 [Firmicutes bacterium]|nr:hypothetical protein [Bacillota bacterium]
MRVIRLTSLSGKPYYFNTDAITSFMENAEGKTALSILEPVEDGAQPYYLVKETPEIIWEMLKDLESEKHE